MREVRSSGGAIGEATDPEIVEAVGLLARTEGIFAETAGGVTIAVLAKLAASGVVRPDETVVAYVTGMGLKTLEAFGDRFAPTVAIEPKLEALGEALDRLGLGARKRCLMATVRIPTQMRSLVGRRLDGRGRGRHGRRRSCAAWPRPTSRSRPRLFEPDGRVRRFVNVFLEDEDIRFADGLDTKVEPGQTISLLPAVAGGVTSGLRGSEGCGPSKR